jgi:hypothetical protein
MRGGLRRRTTGPLPGALPPARVAGRRGERHRQQADGRSGAVHRRHRVREDAMVAGCPRRRGRWSTHASPGPATMSGASDADRRPPDAGRRHLASEDHVAGRRRARRHGRCAVPDRYHRGRRPCGPGRSPRSHRSRPDAGSAAGSSMFRQQHERSSGHRGRRRYERRRLPLGPWAFRVPQPRQPTSSICHYRTQTNEEGRSTLSGATLFMYVRRRPTLPRGPPRSTIGAEGLNFRVRNGTGCFPFAITAETLLRCHRRCFVKQACWRPYLGNRTVDAKSKRVKAKPLGLLVPVSYTRCRASTSGLSTQSSSWGPYLVNPEGDLILRRASRLDAFSGYPFRT